MALSPHRPCPPVRRLIASLLILCAQTTVLAADEPDATFAREFFTLHCLQCHDRTDPAGGLAIAELLESNITNHADAWEKVSRKLAMRQMPPRGEPRPDDPDFDVVNSWLTGELDRAAEAHPDPGRTDSLRRLTRTEYQNAVRDLLAIEIDASAFLPQDESSFGFDNITVGDLTPSLVRRYVAAADTISRLAVGGTAQSPDERTFRIRPDVTQDSHIPGLPLGTRGGGLFACNLAHGGEYEIRVWLMRDRNDNVESLKEPHELVVLVDREQAASFTLVPPAKGESDKSVDANLTVRMTLSAGPHDIGAAFQRMSYSLLETRRQPLDVHYNFYRHPRLGPAVYQVSVTGPFYPIGPDDTPSRRRIFVSRPASPEDEEPCAHRILESLLPRAYRRPVTEADFIKPIEAFRQGREAHGFDAGIERAIAAVLVNPNFLFRIERDPPSLPQQTAYRISDVELASRLSFFLWSSIPDDELLELAIRGELSKPEVLDQQVRRMLADEKAASLTTNFADQWLHLRNLDAVIPDGRLFPDFDDNLRQAFRQETELLFGSIVRNDRSVVDLLSPDETYVNERLARYYGIPHVYGDRFREVSLAPGSQRGGLLRQGSVLSVTSYATRTSPVLRGKWVLENLLGTPPPPPPPNIPALADNTVSSTLPLRERLAAHRENEACAACHAIIDPVGFSLENFDAVGRWRELDAGLPIDASGGLPDGSEFTGVDGLERALCRRPEPFVRTLTEKLLTFALGRGVEARDAPAIRKIVRDAEPDDYRFSSLILGIAHSTPFQMRNTP